MAIKNGKQPQVRFDAVGPFSLQGVSYLPKVQFFSITGLAGTENVDFWVAPAGTRIIECFVRVDTTVNNSGVVTLGTDGDADALITSTVFGTLTAGSWASNLLSTVAGERAGIYLHSGDTLRCAITGTATTGALSGYLIYFEVEAMVNDGYHIQAS